MNEELMAEVEAHIREDHEHVPTITLMTPEMMAQASSPTISPESNDVGVAIVPNVRYPEEPMLKLLFGIGSNMLRPVSLNAKAAFALADTIIKAAAMADMEAGAAFVVEKAVEMAEALGVLGERPDALDRAEADGLFTCTSCGSDEIVDGECRECGGSV